MSRFVRRLASAIAMWVIALFVIFSGNELVFLLLIGTLGFAGLWEYFTMIKQAGLSCFKTFGLVCGAAFFIGSFLVVRSRGTEGAYDFEMAMLLVFLIGVFARQMFRPVVKSAPLEAMAYTLFGLLYVAWLFNFLTEIVYAVPRAPDGVPRGQFYVLYLVVVTKFSDMGAYLVGSRIGKHQMVPHISPAKTWEGFVGSFVFAILGSYLLLWMLPRQLGYLNVVHGTLLGFLIGVGAVVGDLGESIIKRSTGVKDSGSMLPGIGGMLDLIDSLLFTAPLMFFYLRFLVHQK
ncbi:MAG: phosphatidate cytidylyltransferase [Verrucomicrobia bacterium]|nr:phosphatidate cytidylyltransferase [Verrucomicrobiota bacterium]